MWTFLCTVLAGCAAGPHDRHPQFEQRARDEAFAGECVRLLSLQEQLIEASHVRDAQSVQLRGFPYLRTDRLLVALAGSVADEARFAAWVEAMRQLDLESRRLELANLPREARSVLDRAAPARLDTSACTRALSALDRSDTEGRERLLRRARAPDAYRTWMRALGLYPLTSLPFLAAVAALHAEIRRDFERPRDELPVAGRLVRFVPPDGAGSADSTGAARLLPAADRDPLGFPVLGRREIDGLFDRHAPIFEVDVVSDDDRLGAPRWREPGRPSVDTARPTVYRLLGHAIVDGEVVVQLSYVIWFPARPLSGPLDILGGHMDGIIWRVTLGADGSPLIHDSVHSCGCYHMFFPGARVTPRAPAAGHEEPVLVPQVFPGGNGRVVIRVAHRTHYLQRVYLDPAPTGGVVYGVSDYDALRALPLPDGGSRSLFADNALVPGTERAERWLFWPMGVVSAGAMRQWGHHAVAFVGRRHFDDPDLIERYFEVQ